MMIIIIFKVFYAYLYVYVLCECSVCSACGGQ